MDRGEKIKRLAEYDRRRIPHWEEYDKLFQGTNRAEWRRIQPGAQERFVTACSRLWAELFPSAEPA